MAVPRRERKVVTVVFCDLVGFTARAESMDPEDVEALLGPYHERVRAELERHGGTVEKFIGDAVMALFGAPTAHEDDPERAARAALAIRDFATDEGLELRVGITTGEALVRLDANPGAGEGMASGDVVNTAARLQSAAPVNGVVVDETTYRATRAAVDYEEAEPVEAKGKAEPIPVWEAVRAHSRLGIDVAHEARSRLVGRERELSAVRDAFDRARHARTPQLLTIVGVPGIGKSRLVYELRRIVDADPDIINWRQGRCLAYGDGVTLWALAEIVKAQAGVAEQDSPADVVEKLRNAAAEAVSETDVDWVESHLLALVGLAEETALGGNRRDEAFSAWRHFLEGLAEHRPLVLVFEDLHWADESLLDFVDELCDWITDVPLLVVGTARPELLERRPGWGGGKLNATTLALAPLTGDETAQVLGEALGTPVLPADIQAALLERAGGNPLYAEQFAELYRERGSTEDLPLPETLQGIISARLDGLGRDEKTLLLDAAVVGKVFWTGSLGRDENDVTAAVHSLERKGFVRRQRRSSVEGQSELAFAHALVRDVAYGQIPRAERATKHRRVAEWIESLGRPEDHAEMRAYHWQAALELALAAGQPTEGLHERSRLALRDAGDRAARLNSYAAAAAFYDKALVYWPDDIDRSRLLLEQARALVLAADERRIEALEVARDSLLASNDPAGAADAEALLAQVSWYRGDQEDVLEHVQEAERLVEEAEPSVGVARVLAVSGRYRALAGDRNEGIRIARHALAMAEALSLDELRAHALVTIGTARFLGGEDGGQADVEQALEIALAIDSPVAATALNNLGVIASHTDMSREFEFVQQSRTVAERLGDREAVRFSRGNSIFGLWSSGRWDEALAEANAFVAGSELRPHYLEGLALQIRAEIRLGRGELKEALEDSDRALELSRRAPDPQNLFPSLAQAARHRLKIGRLGEALEIAREFVAEADRLEVAPPGYPQLTPYATELRLEEELRRIVDRVPDGRYKDIAVADLDRDFTRAAELFASLRFPAAEAERRHRAAEELVATGERREALVQLERALAFYRSVGASYHVAQIEDALAEAQRDSA
jgi:class 3 adenylate cyclase/predicted ATPase